MSGRVLRVNNLSIGILDVQMLEKIRGLVRYFALSACLFFAPAAQALESAHNANSIYVGILGGLTLLEAGPSEELRTDAGYNYGGVIGYKWAFGLRAEGEVSYHRSPVDLLDLDPALEGGVNALAFMGNVWYDILLPTTQNLFYLPITISVGGGLGVAHVTADISDDFGQSVDDKDTVFAWQVGADIGIEVFPGIVITSGFRYLATADPDLTDVFGADLDAKYGSGNINFGVRVHF